MPELRSLLKIFKEHGESRKRSVSDRAPSVLNLVKVSIFKGLADFTAKPF